MPLRHLCRTRVLSACPQLQAACSARHSSELGCLPSNLLLPIELPSTLRYERPRSRKRGGRAKLFNPPASRSRGRSRGSDRDLFRGRQRALWGTRKRGTFLVGQPSSSAGGVRWVVSRERISFQNGMQETSAYTFMCFVAHFGVPRIYSPDGFEAPSGVF